MIVAVFGKSQYRAKGCKTGMLSSVLQVDLLDEPTVDESSLVNCFYFNTIFISIFLILKK